MLTIGRVAGVEEVVLRLERVAGFFVATLADADERFVTDERVGYKRSR